MRIFNRLRLNAIQFTKIRKYLIYAIGEILLITIGILIALNLNNWNQDQNAKAVEIKTLKEIHLGLSDDLKDLQMNCLAVELTRYHKGIESLLAHQGAGNKTLEIPRLPLGISSAK